MNSTSEIPEYDLDSEPFVTLYPRHTLKTGAMRTDKLHTCQIVNIPKFPPTEKYFHLKIINLAKKEGVP